LLQHVLIPSAIAIGRAAPSRTRLNAAVSWRYCRHNQQHNAYGGDTPRGTFDALPDGIYRITFADLPFRVITTEELLASGTVFLFRKVGNKVSGDFYIP